MRATQVVGRGQVAFVDMPEPSPRAGHVLVRPLLISLCGSDVHMLHHAAENRYPFPVGTTGHEVIAEVVAADDGEGTVRPGDLTLTLAPRHTAMSELFLAPWEDVLPLPDCGSLEHLLMAQQLGTVTYACKRLPNLVGLDVAVIGQGSAGLFFDAMCRRSGARHVIGIDVQEARLAASSAFGATHAVNAEREDSITAVQDITGGSMADLVIEAAGTESAINLAPCLVKRGGNLLFFGIPHVDGLSFDYEAFFRKCCSTVTCVGAGLEPGRCSFKQALDMIASGDIDVSPMLTHRLPFARVLEAYQLATTKEDGAIKIVVEMPYCCESTCCRLRVGSEGSCPSGF